MEATAGGVCVVPGSGEGSWSEGCEVKRRLETARVLQSTRKGGRSWLDPREGQRVPLGKRPWEAETCQ